MDFASLTGGLSFGRSKGTSGSEADDETQLTFYTEQYRSRRRSKGKGKFPNLTVCRLYANLCSVTSPKVLQSSTESVKTRLGFLVNLLACMG